MPADAERRECPLVLVSGAPATGKTTLATLLAQRLRLPLLAKDELKEVLYDTLGAPDPEASRRLASCLAGVRDPVDGAGAAHRCGRGRGGGEQLLPRPL